MTMNSIASGAMLDKLTTHQGVSSSVGPAIDSLGHANIVGSGSGSMSSLVNQNANNLMQN